MNVSVKRLVRSLQAAKRLILWSWYWVPMCIAYIVLRGVSWIGDKAYTGAEWINAHPPKWDTANARREFSAASAGKLDGVVGSLESDI